MRRAMTQKLMATSAATLLSVLLAMPASAQGQDREGRGGTQAGQSQNMRGGGGEMRGGNQGEFRGDRTQRGAQAGGRVRGQAATEGTIGRRGNLQQQTRVRGDARIRSDNNVRIRGDRSARIRGDADVRIRGDNNVRTSFRGDRWRGDDWRFRDRTRVSVGVGFSDPYYSYGYSSPSYAYGYDDGYDAYAAAEPYAYRRPFVGAYGSFAASPGCTCAPGAYGAYATTYDSGWGWGSSWDRGRW